MSKKLVPTWSQREKIAALVDEFDIKTYREVKAALGLGRMKPFQKLNYTEALQIIGMLESLKRERFGGQGEQVFDAYSHQSRPSQPHFQGVLEPVQGERAT